MIYVYVIGAIVVVAIILIVFASATIASKFDDEKIDKGGNKDE